MPYIFTLLLLAFIILLIFGIFKPQQALFWYKGERTKKQSATIYSMGFAAALIGLVATIPDVPKEPTTDIGVPLNGTVKPKEETKTIPFTSPYSTATFNYNLPGSEYNFEVTLSDIKIFPAKNAFEIKTDEYTPPVKQDGYDLQFSFSMTNPYDKEMICPVPDNFYVANIVDSFFSERKMWRHSCGCDVNDITHVTVEDGRDLKDITSKRGCGNTSYYCFTFQPNETKIFRVKFLYPILGSVKKLLLAGFDRTEREGKKNYYEKCWIIDVDAKSFVGEMLNK